VDEVIIVSFAGLAGVKDVSDYLARGGTKEKLLERAKSAPKAALRIIDPTNWAADPLPKERKWIVPNYIPEETTTILVGDGGAGKSYLCHQLEVAMALARDWIGRRSPANPSSFHARTTRTR
jgi:hypothetical protein